MGRYHLPRANPSDPRTNPSLSSAYNDAADAIDDLDNRTTLVEGRPPGQGPPGPAGPMGPMGPALILGWVPNVASLPPAGNNIGDAYLVGPNEDVYAWTGTAWQYCGSLKGDPGLSGPPGPGLSQGDADTRYVNVSGDRMTGNLDIGAATLNATSGDIYTTGGMSSQGQRVPRTTVSAAAPSGGSDGDVWYQVTP
jgi:hypothetical protein